jgi:hypothetical protein
MSKNVKKDDLGINQNLLILNYFSKKSHKFLGLAAGGWTVKCSKFLKNAPSCAHSFIPPLPAAFLPSTHFQSNSIPPHSHLNP